MLPYLFWMSLWLRDLAGVQHHISRITRDKRKNFLRKKVTTEHAFHSLVKFINLKLGFCFFLGNIVMWFVFESEYDTGSLRNNIHIKKKNKARRNRHFISSVSSCIRRPLSSQISSTSVLLLSKKKA